MSTPHDITPVFTSENLHQTLRNLREPTKFNPSPLVQSALVAKQLHAQPELSLAHAAKAVLTEALTQLEENAPDLAALLRGRFWEGVTVAEMVNAGRPVAQSERRFYTQQRQALQRFAILLEEAERDCAQQQARHPLLPKLPMATYQQLFGVEIYSERLVRYLQNPNHHPIISIKGIGGIGKTALADIVVRKLLASNPPLHDLVWISAKQEYLTGAGIIGSRMHIRVEQIFDELGSRLGLNEVVRLPLGQKIERLAQVLRVVPHLIVLDNLEDVDDLCRLTPWLERLAIPTQFLLTTRETVPTLTTITQVDLNELERTAAIALIEFTAAKKEICDFDPQEVYTLVGGNPLAILLLVSQMQFLPPSVVLKGIQLGSLEEIYRYIYWKSWHMLDLFDQDLLLAIQRAGNVADWDWLQIMMDVPTRTLSAALQRLIDLSLVQPQRHDADQRIFAIHRLTATFLHTEVLGWK